MGEGEGMGTFRDERLFPTAFMCGEHGVGVDENGLLDACDSFVRPASMKGGLTNALSAWELVLQTDRNAGKRR